MCGGKYVEASMCGGMCVEACVWCVVMGAPLMESWGRGEAVCPAGTADGCCPVTKRHLAEFSADGTELHFVNGTSALNGTFHRSRGTFFFTSDTGGRLRRVLVRGHKTAATDGRA